MQAKRRNGFVIMANLVALLGNFAYFLIFAVLNGSLGYLCAMGVTVFGAIAIAKILGETIALSYGWIITIVLICGLLRGALKYVEQYSNHYIAFKLLAILRDKIFKALRKLAPARLEEKKKGDLISLVTADIETLEVFYAHTLSPILICLVVNTSILIFVGCISSWYLSLIALVFYLIIGVLTPLSTSKRMNKTGVRYRKELGAFNAYYLDSIKGVRDIILHNNQMVRRDEINKRSDSLLEETKRLKHDSVRASACTELIISLCTVLSIAVGVILIGREELTIGKMIIGIVTILSSFGPVVAISALPSDLTQTFASGDRYLTLLAEKPKVEEINKETDIVFQQLNINNMCFSYDENVVLNNITMQASKGEIVGIVGESGCGKSTILKLLLRFYSKNSGEILYNGIDIESINTASLLNNVTMVCQNTYLFDDTIYENLRIAKENATMEEIICACQEASIHDFIMSLPDGYNTRVGSFLENISAGEKQRIGLARAFLRGSSLILLDEPTSNVDSINEGIILQALAMHKKDKCIILVSHRESTMAIADRVYKFTSHQFVET